MHIDKKNSFIVLAFLLAFFTHFHFVVKTIASHGIYRNDFVHYTQVCIALFEGKPYDTIFCALHSLGFFFLVIPLSLMPGEIAGLVWVVGGYAALFASLWLILKIYRDTWSAAEWCMVLFLLFSFKALKEQFLLSQPDLLILFFISLCLWLVHRKKLWWAGACLGVAVSMREYFAVAAILLVWRRQYRLLGGLCAGFLFLKACGILAFGWSNEVLYWKTIIQHASHTYVFGTNVSLPAALYRLGNVRSGENAWLALLSAAVRVILLLWALWMTRLRRVQAPQGECAPELCLFLVLSCLLTPWIHESHYMAIFPAVLICWICLDTARDPWAGWGFIAAYMLLSAGYAFSSFTQFEFGWGSLLNTSRIAGLLILLFLLGRVCASMAPEGKTR